MSERHDRGRAGEEYVCGWLRDRGWDIAARNYRIRGGEIDIVAQKGNTIAFVEVKTRKAGTLSEGVEAMTPKKQDLIIRTAERYIQEHPDEDREIRFDAAFVTVTTGDIPRVVGMEYLENAFDAFSVPDSCEQI